MLEVWENILLAIVSSLKDVFIAIFLGSLSLPNSALLEDITRVFTAVIRHWPSSIMHFGQMIRTLERWR